jgi:hypothetical protein
MSPFLSTRSDIVSDCRYFARIGSWALIIGFSKELNPPPFLIEGLSFLLEPVPMDLYETHRPDILLHHLVQPIAPTGIQIKKQDRIIHWFRRRRVITGPRFQVRILEPFKIAEVSSPVAWEDLADIIESWVGFHYEQRRGVRLHALATKDFTLVAPSGFGKTHYALTNLQQVISDEVVYVHDRKIENWHSALRIKEPGSWNSRHGSRRVIGIQCRPQALPLIKLGNCNWWSIFIGLGLPQHLEFSLFISSLPGWIQIAARRLLLIIRHRLFFCSNDFAR